MNIRTIAILVTGVITVTSTLHAAEFHVALSGSDANPGAKKAPFRTVQRAADLARAGDVITVHAGVYRERVTPPRGGLSDRQRITFQAAPGERVVITGAEIVKGWERATNDTWKVAIPNSFFGSFNPYADLIHGDWFDAKGRAHHTGAVYLNREWLTEAAKRDAVFEPDSGAPLWFGEVAGDTTTLWAQFKGVNPNEETVEVNVRRTVFTPEKTGIDYITLRGFDLRDAATPWAPPTAGQIGIVSAYWCKGWIIEDNEISYSTCCGVALGKYSDAWDNRAESAEGYVGTLTRALTNGWNQATVGGHIVRHNHIHHCEQTGVVGSLGCSFSTVTGNVIHDIHLRQLFGGAEMAGIKFHGAIDVIISHNHIYRCGDVAGIWLDWMAQGARVTGNLMHDNTGWCGDLFFEMQHGPLLTDNNLLLSKHRIYLNSKGVAFAHNLIAAPVEQERFDGRDTPFHKPHSTEVAGLHNSTNGDQRFYNNLFAAPSSLNGLDNAMLPCFAEGNVFTHGARPSKFDAGAVLASDYDLGIKLTERPDGWYLELSEDPRWRDQASRKRVTTELLGKAVVSGCAYENRDGSPLRIDTDYFGAKRGEKSPFPGPFEVAASANHPVKVWTGSPGRAALGKARGGASAVVCPPGAPRNVRLAAQEVRRYVYLRTGKLLPIAEFGAGIVLKLDPSLGAQDYRLKGNGEALVISGGSDVAVLYGAYRFAEKLGVRFYLHGDVIPDERCPLLLAEMDETSRPLFALRGIQPFHDFMEGPDWWNRDDYKAYASQLAKLRMNFIGLHNYPQSEGDYPGGEPTVWIGRPEDCDADGRVTHSYTALFANTLRPGWGNAPMKTSQYAGGASVLFEGDVFGPDAQRGYFPWPTDPAGCNEVFNRTAEMYRDAFGFARSLGIKLCVGTETPMTVPRQVKDKLRSQGRDPGDPAVTRELYRGVFQRLTRAFPVDYYWLWTPEGWTWSGNQPGELEKTQQDIRAALGALDDLGNPFPLATCGWVLGPASDRAALDALLPKTSPMACINRQVGHEGVEPSFANVIGRPKWAIPWFENDPNLVGPQPWAARMRYDAADARRFGCTGLFGLHWRVKAMEMNVAALAAAGWDQSWVPADFDTRPVKPSKGGEGAMGGQTASFTAPVADTTTPEVYQTVRYDLNGYQLAVPNGNYTVTLQFNEPAYAAAGKRVFGVKLQGRQVVTGLDVFARVGANRALDLSYPDIAVSDGQLRVEFTREVEFPCIAGIVIEGATQAANQVAGAPFARRINCGGPKVGAYEADLVGGGPPVPPSSKTRAMPIDDFYEDYARAQFGATAAREIARVLARIDGAALPEVSGWNVGPGVVTPNPKPWAEERKRYAFVDELAALRSRVKGAGNLDRFDYWLGAYQAMAAMAEAGCLRGQLDAAMKEKQGEQALAARVGLARAWSRLLTLQTSIVRTPGELGTIANLEQQTRSRAHFVDGQDEALVKAIGHPLPDSALLERDYTGSSRLIVPTVRGVVDKGESLHLRIIALDRQPGASVTVHVRALGRGSWRTVAARHLGRDVYEATLPPADEDFEYRISAATAAGRRLVWPVTAPAMNQSVVVAPPA